MRVFEANISEFAAKEIKTLMSNDVDICNSKLKKLTGVCHFFKNQQEFNIFVEALENEQIENILPNRKQYGDFQTNSSLAGKVCDLLKKKNVQPEIIIEPTFGEGTFILSALDSFPSIKKIIGVEIYSPYFWQTKFLILDYF